MLFAEPEANQEERRFDCKYCGKVFKSHNYVKMHEKWHKGELQHKCNECGREFRYPSELKKHIAIHTGELPYKCDHCGRSFNRVQVLNEHVRVDHQGEAPRPIPIKRELVKYDIERNLEQELFKNISNSEMSFKQKQNDMMRGLGVGEPSIMGMDQTISDSGNDVFAQLQREYGISFGIPEANNTAPNNQAYLIDSVLQPNTKQEDHFLIQARREQKLLEEFEDDWSDDPSLPRGWKSNVVGHFMSPDGQTFGSRRAVREFLMRHGASEGDIELVSRGVNQGLKGGVDGAHRPNDGCPKCRLIKEFERKLEELKHQHKK